MSDRRRVVVVGLLSHYFEDDNLGCVALSISNVLILDQVAEGMGIDIEYRILVNEKHPDIALTFTRSKYQYLRYSSAKETARHPIQLLRTKIFDQCDFVMNINAGDGFTDIYGLPRMLAESYMNLVARLKRTPIILAPQTIGPFSRSVSRWIAGMILRNSVHVFSRDGQSTELCRQFELNETLTEVIDLAFALPFTPVDFGETDRTRVGVNVSGLLYRGGYDRANYFKLAFDYREYAHQLVARFLEHGYEVHLVPHVIADAEDVEDDYSACEAVKRLYPSAVLAPRFEDPIEVKSYIAGLDFFTGARMHSTIAAISSGVPVVPVGYSRKMPGLFDTLGYPYYVDARSQSWSLERAVVQIATWIINRDELQACAMEARAVFVPRLARYGELLSDIVRKGE